MKIANCTAIGAVLFLLAIAPPRADAGMVLGIDVADYVLLYQGGGSGKKLSINNFGFIGPTRRWIGDIGIAGSGKLAASGPGTLVGDIHFAAANTGQASISNTTIDGNVVYGVSAVQSTMNALNTLSSSLSLLPGTSLAINTNSTQTVLATAGALSGNNRIFSVTSNIDSGNGENLIIKGTGSQNVVFNINTPGEAKFHGNVLLQDLTGKFFGDAGYAGLFPDQVLFNLYAGSGLVGGDKLDGNNNGNNAHPNNFIYGTFLNPNGKISFVNTRIVGRIFGGDSDDMQIVSGDSIFLPTGPPDLLNDVPEPSTVAYCICSAAGFVLLRRRRQSSVAMS